MNIQIFGKSKCFDTKKAERYFKERRIKYQYIDLLKHGMSRGELKSVVSAVGLDALVDEKSPDYPLLKYLAYDEDKLEKLFEDPSLIKTPVVRNGRQATVGYKPEVWKNWE
ncbi:MAG: arsenate reductase family protein [Oscillospiraceae bacterium]|jgi:arsenate reductase